jgi:DnaJ-class molecular chaperone
VTPDLPARTLADMSERQNTPRACTNCGGDKGHTVEENDRGKLIQVWRPCGPCHGTGVQGGGI